MSQYGSWSVKGVDDRARAIAKEKARLKGITLGDYINNLLLEGHSEAGPRDMSRYHESPLTSAFSEPTRPHALDGLAQRIEAVEARSTLAITGIDQSVLGLLARLESSENSTSAMTAEVERMVDELRETHEMLHDKVGALEADESGRRSLEAMKALEDALGKLATHVYEEGRLNQDDSTAMKGRIEAGFGELNERVEGVEIKVESTLAEAAQRVEKAVEQAELRAEGTSRHLSERVSNIESSVATKLANVDDVSTRMKTVEGDVSSAISSMEGTLLRVQERLNRAEQTTDKALQALEGTFASLDQRINSVAEHANPEKTNALRHELEQRFDALAKDLRVSVEESRRHLADEIERAASGNNPELMGALETRVNALEATDIGARLDGVDGQLNHLSDTLVRHVEESENRSASAIEKVGEQVVGLSESLHQRVTETEQRNADAIGVVGDQVSGLSETFNQRIADSERRSAGAIEQVGEQVATAIKHVQARQEQNQRQLAEKVAGSESRQEARLSDALSNISDRLSDMQSQTATAVSPVQRAIVTLASRLEALEDFTAPPLAEPAAAALPDMPTMEVDSSPIEMEPALAPDPEPVLDVTPELESDPIETEHFADSIVAMEAEATETEESDFIAGLPDFDDAPVESDSADPATISLNDDWTDAEADPDTASETPDGDEYSDVFLDDEAQNKDDPLAELGSWEDSQEEARDSDIFSSDEEAEEPIDLLPAFEEADLAHNTADMAADESEQLDEFDPNDDTPSDYLTRARDAAIAAASDPKADAKARRGRRSAASAPLKPSSNRKFPIIAAASVFALSAAGAGAWVALRGKIPFTEANAPAVETKTTLAEAGIEAPTEPSLSGIEFAEPTTETLDETLFEDEGSVAGIIEVQPAEAPPIAEITAPVILPTIPDAVTVEQAANDGNPVAQFQLGLERLEAQEFAAAAGLISSAAEQGLPAAQYRMAKLHERGIGVPRDFAEARAWTERAANGGNIKAMHDLAVFYADGEGGAQSYAAAAEWSKKAADFGVVDSQYNLALLYENGLGISPSQTEALYWYEIAAANGDASAPGNVATLRDALPLDQAQEAQRRASNWTKAIPNAAANGDFGPQDWTQASRAQVQAVQEILNGLGYEAGPADGLVGAGTRTAIRAFQADNGLPTSGTIETSLIETLNAQSQAFSG
jgi:localization factor PodJL